MPRRTDWYWAAEQDKISSDLDLRLVPSPEGWPSGGLECVGLYLLMINLMWMSPKSGYLCDPVHTHLPLKTTELATLVGRDVQVVERVLKVLLDRNMFSITSEGMVFSRGILRRLSLRKKRATAGRKGGLRRKVLLKQTVQQKGEQSVTLAIAIPSSGGGVQGREEISLSHLAQKAAFDEGWGGSADRIGKWYRALGDVAALGKTLDEISAELGKKPYQSEPPWEFLRRMRGDNGRSGQGMGSGSRVRSGERGKFDAKTKRRVDSFVPGEGQGGQAAPAG